MGSNAAAGYSEIYQSYALISGGRDFRFSVWLKANSGTPTVVVRNSDNAGNNGAVNVTLTSSWVRYTSNVVTLAASRTSLAAELGCMGTNYGGVANTATAIDISVWGAQLEEVSGQSNQNPGEYLSVGVLGTPYHGSSADGAKSFLTKNGNTVASNIVTEAVGAVFTTGNGASTATVDTGGPWGLLLEEQRVDIAAYSFDFDNAVWGKSQATVTANTTLGPDGSTTADTFNEDATTNWHYLIRTNTKTGVAITYTMSVYAKKSGRNWLAMDLTDSVTNCLAWFDLNNGVVGSISAGSFTNVTSTITAMPNGFYRCTMTTTTPATTTLNMLLSSANADAVTSIAGLNGAALILWGAQLEVGAYASSLYPSGAAAATRQADAFTYPFVSNADATVGTVYAEVTSLWTTANAANPVVAFATATNYPLYSNSEAATTLRTNDGTNTVQKTGLSSTATAVRKRAASWTGSTLAIAGDGLAAASGTFDGNMGSTAIGVGNPTTFSGVVWNGNIRNLKLYTVAATAAQLQSLTA
jgi:hypothetical protein